MTLSQKRGTHAKIHEAAKMSARMLKPNLVDTARQKQLIHKPQIGGRETELTRPALSVHDHSGERHRSP